MPLFISHFACARARTQCLSGYFVVWCARPSSNRRAIKSCRPHFILRRFEYRYIYSHHATNTISSIVDWLWRDIQSIHHRLLWCHPIVLNRAATSQWVDLCGQREREMNRFDWITICIQNKLKLRFCWPPVRPRSPSCSQKLIKLDKRSHLFIAVAVCFFFNSSKAHTYAKKNNTRTCIYRINE